MHLIKVDPVGPEPSEARVDRAHDIATGRAFEHFPRIHGDAELSRQHNIVAARAEDLAEALLGSTEMTAAETAIDVGDIEQGDAEIERLVHDLARRLQIDAPAEIVAAEPDDRDLQAGSTQVALPHGNWSLSERGWPTCSTRPAFVKTGKAATRAAPTAMDVRSGGVHPPART